MEVLSFSNIGKRDNNEDYISVTTNCLIVCDGVGGVNKGEIASEFVATKLSNSLNGRALTINVIQKEVSIIQDELNQLAISNAEMVGMGTTLASLLLSNGEFYTCHVGDSRVYHFKPTKGVYSKTKDHSLVEELLASNHITEEQALHHPKKNVITKALISDVNRAKDTPTISKVENVEEGDIFLICSDGVTEAWQDKHLAELLLKNSTELEEILEELQNQCTAFSKDNNSAILVKVQKEDIENESIESVQDTIPALQKDDERNNPTITKNNKRSPNFIKWLLLLTILIGSAIAFLFVYIQTNTKSTPTIIKEPLKSNDIQNKEIHKDTKIESDKTENTNRINPNPAPNHKTISTSTKPNLTLERVHSNNKSANDKNKSNLSDTKPQVGMKVRVLLDEKSTTTNPDSIKNNSNDEQPKDNIK